MRLQGSIHRWTDGIGYGAFIPTDRAYYSANDADNSDHRARPSSEKIEAYRRKNNTAGIATHRTDISYGRTSESVKPGTPGDSRAREATRSLTSGEVGGFCWPNDLAKARPKDLSTILAGGSASITQRTPHDRGLPAATREALTRRQRWAREGGVAAARSGSSGQDGYMLTSRSSASSTPSSSSSSARCCPSSARPSASPRTPSSGVFHGKNLDDPNVYGCGDQGPASARASILVDDPRQSKDQEKNLQNGRRRTQSVTMNAKEDNHALAGLTAGSSEPSLLPSGKLDPVFERHRKYDLLAAQRAARGGDVMDRFGPVDATAVSAASLLTSELSTPWSHMLHGQKGPAPSPTKPNHLPPS